MTRNNGSQFQTAFTLSIEAAQGVTTGISAADRAHTIRTAVQHDVAPGCNCFAGSRFSDSGDAGRCLSARRA